MTLRKTRGRGTNSAKRALCRITGGQRTGVLALLFLLAALIVGCGSDSSSESSSGATDTGATSGGAEEDVVFGFSHPYGEVPVVQLTRSGVSKFAEEDGWEVLLDPTQEADLQGQLAVIDTWITQGITAMNVFPVQPSAYETTAQRAVDAGIIWTSYINKMDVGAGGVLLPGDLSGTVTGEAVVKWINENDPEAEVLILTASEQTELQDRVDIPKEMIEKETKATIVAEQDAVAQDTGLQVAEDVLQAHPDVSVIVGFNDDGALGAADALRKEGKLSADEVFVIGQDGAVEALEELTKPNSYYSASAVIDGPEFYKAIVDLVKRAIDKGWEEGDEQEYVELPPTLITHENAEEAERLLAEYDELLE
jgi:ribose transport system substrate-binding protein